MKNIMIYRDKGLIDKNLIESFEISINHIFAAVYKDFISIHNAARPEFENFDFFNSFIQQNDSRDVNFYGYGNHLPDYEKIDLAQKQDIFMPNGIVVFGYSANGDYICFDYRQDPETDNPPIVVMYHDAYDDDEKMYVDFVAKDFETFMDSLYGYDEDDNKIYPED